MVAHPHTDAYRNKKETRITISVLGSAAGRWPLAAGRIVVAGVCNHLFYTDSRLSWPSAGTSADYNALPVELARTFVPEASGPSDVLPVLGCGPFPSTHVRNERGPGDRPHFDVLPLKPWCDSSPAPPWGSGPAPVAGTRAPFATRPPPRDVVSPRGSATRRRDACGGRFSPRR